jgi:surface antigen
MADPVAGQLITEMTSSGYTSAGGNPFTAPNCTWYAWGRAKEKYNKSITFKQNSGRDADKWYGNGTNGLVSNCTLESSTWTPTADVIACFESTGSNSGGHVVFIEAVRTAADGTMNIFFTDDYDGDSAPGYLVEKTLSAFKTLYSNLSLQGYLLVY